MKYLIACLLFLSGLILGRWTVVNESSSIQSERVSISEKNTENYKRSHRDNLEEDQELQGSECVVREASKDPRFKRTMAKKNNKKIQRLFYDLLNAMSNDDLKQQNKIFEEMEELNPFHEKVFEAKVRFLQDDGDWDGAYEVLKSCAEKVPQAIYCHRRLSNIRTSTVEDKIKHSQLCLKQKKDDVYCLINLAIAYRSNAEFSKAKELFEKALSFPAKTVGYDRRYVLYQYAFTLDELSLKADAVDAWSESCDLSFKPACEALDPKERKSS